MAVRLMREDVVFLCLVENDQSVSEEIFYWIFLKLFWLSLICASLCGNQRLSFRMRLICCPHDFLQIRVFGHRNYFSKMWHSETVNFPWRDTHVFTTRVCWVTNTVCCSLTSRNLHSYFSLSKLNWPTDMSRKKYFDIRRLNKSNLEQFRMLKEFVFLLTSIC